MIDHDVDKIRDLAWEFRRAAEQRATALNTDRGRCVGTIRDRQADMLAELAEQVYILSQRG